MSQAWGTYVHVPWCRRRCPYCAFYVEVDRDTPWESWLEGIRADQAALEPLYPGTSQTVFLGGGTPSRMPTDILSALLDALPREADAEVTAETNPEDAGPEWLDGALRAGVTRLSVGLQTFNPRFARLLNRACSVDDARQTTHRVARAGFDSWSVDLIFALPGQTLDDLRSDLSAILETGAPHVSLYGLTFEPGTPFERARDRGQLEEVDGDLWREMYDLIVETLQAAGLERYEISNFARPGHRSRHNQLYWTDAPYKGLGPSAHGYAPDGRRYHNPRDLARWRRAPDDRAWEAPDADTLATDLLVSGLRGVEGLSEAHLLRRTGATVDPTVRGRLVAAGLLADAPGVLRLGFDGFPLADAVIARLVDALVF